MEKVFVSNEVHRSVSRRYRAIVKEAIDEVNWLFNQQAFLEAIKEHGDFDLSNDQPPGSKVDGNELVEHIENYNSRCSVRGYKYPTLNILHWLNEHTLKKYVYGRWTRRLKKVIQLNNRFLHRDRNEIRATIAHELIHVIDNTVGADFGHGGNKNVGKENTAPYWVGALAQSWDVSR